MRPPCDRRSGNGLSSFHESGEVRRTRRRTATPVLPAAGRGRPAAGRAAAGRASDPRCGPVNRTRRADRVGLRLPRIRPGSRRTPAAGCRSPPPPSPPARLVAAKAFASRVEQDRVAAQFDAALGESTARGRRRVARDPGRTGNRARDTRRTGLPAFMNSLITSTCALLSVWSDGSSRRPLVAFTSGVPRDDEQIHVGQEAGELGLHVGHPAVLEPSARPDTRPSLSPRPRRGPSPPPSVPRSARCGPHARVPPTRAVRNSGSFSSVIGRRILADPLPVRADRPRPSRGPGPRG